MEPREERREPLTVLIVQQGVVGLCRAKYNLSSNLKLMGYNRESKLRALESALRKGDDSSSCILHRLESRDTRLFVFYCGFFVFVF